MRVLLSSAVAGRVLLTALALSPAFPAAAQPAARSALTLAGCRLDGVPVPASCGELGVFEDRGAGAGQMIDLEIVVIPAVANDARPDPLFILAGGPGQAATDLVRPLLPVLREVRQRRDLVFVDQRGTGGSGELTCAFFETDFDDQELAESFQFDNLPLDRLRECLAEIESEADPRHYTTPLAMDDLDDVRSALGYDAINLYGGSYGTRAALVYMRRHPERVRTAVLDGLAPVSMRLPSNMGVDGRRALEELFADCATDAGCSEAFPLLPQTFERVVRDLEVGPRTLETPHPRTGEPFEFTVTAEIFGGGLRGVLYDPTLASLAPLTIARAAEGDFAPFLAQIVALESAGTLSLGMFLSVICAEDVSQFGAGEAERLAAEGILGRASIQLITRACGVWPAGELPEGYFDPVRSDAPTLLLSGALDPVTPPRWGEQVLATLDDARHLVAPGAGHGVLVRGCADDLVAEFIDTADHGALDAACLERMRRPPFMLSAAGTDP